MKRRILKTVVSANIGALAHFLAGLVAGLLEPWLFTLLFLTKQGLDVYGGEPPAETSWDISCFTMGLVIGLAIIQITEVI